MICERFAGERFARIYYCEYSTKQCLNCRGRVGSEVVSAWFLIYDDNWEAATACGTAKYLVNLSLTIGTRRTDLL